MERQQITWRTCLPRGGCRRNLFRRPKLGVVSWGVLWRLAVTCVVMFWTCAEANGSAQILSEIAEPRPMLHPEDIFVRNFPENVESGASLIHGIDDKIRKEAGLLGRARDCESAVCFPVGGHQPSAGRLRVVKRRRSVRLPRFGLGLYVYLARRSSTSVLVINSDRPLLTRFKLLNRTPNVTRGEPSSLVPMKVVDGDIQRFRRLSRVFLRGIDGVGSSLAISGLLTGVGPATFVERLLGGCSGDNRSISRSVSFIPLFDRSYSGPEKEEESTERYDPSEAAEARAGPISPTAAWPFMVPIFGWLFCCVLLIVGAVWLVQSCLEIESVAVLPIAKILLAVLLWCSALLFCVIQCFGRLSVCSRYETRISRRSRREREVRETCNEALPGSKTSAESKT